MLTFKEFDHYMKDVVNHIKLSDQVDSLCRKYNVERCISYPDLDYDVVLLLENLMNDENGYIDYWVYELKCGDKYEDGCVKENGVNIPLKTIEDVYNFLSNNLKNNSNKY